MFKKIFHPSDFSETSQVAFCHALRIALGAKSDLRMLHISPAEERGDYHHFPRVREVLERWNVIAKGSKRSAVVKLGIKVNKLVVPGNDAVEKIISDYLAEHRSSLVVMAAHGRGTSWARSRAEPIARASADPRLNDHRRDAESP